MIGAMITKPKKKDFVKSESAYKGEPMEKSEKVKDTDFIKTESVHKKDDKEAELEIEMMIDMGKLKSGKVPPRSKNNSVRETPAEDIVPRQNPLKQYEDMKPNNELEFKKQKYKNMLNKWIYSKKGA